MDKQTGTFIQMEYYTVIKGTNDTDNIDKFQMPCVKWKKVDSKGYILYDSITKMGKAKL